MMVELVVVARGTRRWQLSKAAVASDNGGNEQRRRWRLQFLSNANEVAARGKREKETCGFESTYIHWLTEEYRQTPLDNPNPLYSSVMWPHRRI
jgi:hypothetical protein